jgi:hypothetical protein
MEKITNEYEYFEIPRYMLENIVEHSYKMGQHGERYGKNFINETKDFVDEILKSREPQDHAS